MAEKKFRHRKVEVVDVQYPVESLREFKEALKRVEACLQDGLSPDPADLELVDRWDRTNTCGNMMVAGVISRLPQAEPIPAEYRTVPMTKSQAARLKGYKGTNPAQWVNRRVDLGTMAIEPDGGLFVFDYRGFPRAAWQRILPRSTFEAINSKDEA